MEASLVLVGSGIKFLSHLTLESKAYIEQSDKVLYLVNDPAMKSWIQKSNPNSESLDPLYNSYSLRANSYQAITEYILRTLRQKIHLCVVLYGHPCVFAQPGLNAVLKAKEEGYYAKILPGISAEACLFADLLIDPGSYGCQSFEATDFLLSKPKFHANSHLILWQIDIIGALDNPKLYDNSQGIKLLLNFLSEFYTLDHDIFLYEAAQYPSFEPKIQNLKLGKLPEASLSRISTLYIPPCNTNTYDKKLLQEWSFTQLQNT